MATIKDRYAQIVRDAKDEFPRTPKHTERSHEALAEQRIIAKFRDRARQEFRTLSKSSSK
jgi:hypothetical protein